MANITLTLCYMTHDRRGSAVFWYNLGKDGERDVQSIHGACPTVLGIKYDDIHHIPALK